MFLVCAISRAVALEAFRELPLGTQLTMCPSWAEMIAEEDRLEMAQKREVDEL